MASPSRVGQFGRAVAVVDVVSDLGVASAADIGRWLRLPKSTVHRLLGVLEVHGLVARCAGGFELGGRPLDWAGWERGVLIARTRRRLLPHLVELHRDVGLAVALGVPLHHSVVYPDRLYDRVQLAQISPLLPSSPAYATATGKVLMAFESSVTGRRPAERELIARTPSTITSPRALAEELRRIRAEGLAIAREELLPGVTAMAVPVIDRRLRITVAIGVAGPAALVLRPAVARLLRAGAAAMTQALRAVDEGELSG